MALLPISWSSLTSPPMSGAAGSWKQPEDPDGGHGRLLADEVGEGKPAGERDGRSAARRTAAWVTLARVSS